jgi:hypothetical protein
MMQQLQSSIAVICADAAKSYVRSGITSSLENEEENDNNHKLAAAQIYHFLAGHFKTLSETKQREQKIGISSSSVAEAFNWFATNCGTTTTQFNEKPLFFELADDLKSKIYQSILVDQKRVNQRDITSFLDSKKINTTALPEVFELCRALQQVMQKRLLKLLNMTSNNQQQPAFGTTNIIHFLSVFSSLTPVKSLFELLNIIIDNADRIFPSSSTAATKLVQMISMCFATIDKENARTWECVAMLLGRYPGVNGTLLLELVPSIETMGGGKSSTFVDDVEEKLFSKQDQQQKSPSSRRVTTATSSAGPVVVSYDPEDEEGDGKGGNNDGENDEEEQHQEKEEDVEVRDNFWAGLTSAPQ